ncbi:phenylacetate--CoA ligase [Microvirga sp. STR05]|uniref:Phenylacetate-coenzyme A ligase n=1 Tax=Hymenobacter duratus TaxID=2771356 RepID=A0ABR8JCU4_9BACT|nr:phenylacetate--CoA ligase [Hymenobacter duratus]MBD2713540.1 phenylacetate--CoA ligase [Hymenobacter duratus]MBR7948442.1 phenylacetate--CoA ligase [Microvirga sp. STR05]
MLYNPAIERLPLPQLRALQSARLKEQVAYVYQRVPFYQQKFDALGVNPTTFKGLEELPKLGFTKKSDFRDNYPFGLFAVPQPEVARLHCSSGTTGKATVVGYTAADLEVFSEVVARSLAAAGCRPGMKMQNAYGYGLFTGGMGIHYGAEKLGMTVIPISGGSTDRQLQLLQDFQPEVICATPSYAQVLAEELKRRGIPLDAINLQLAVLGAEPWSEAIRGQVQQGLNVRASNIYGLSEIMGPGVSQEDVDEQGTGSYIWEDHFYPEIVHQETGEPVAEGEMGVLVLTTLTKKAMPILRYWTGDITNIYYEHSHKRTHVKMGPIRGRADDMLIIRGVNFFHTQVEDIINSLENVSPYYQVVASRRGSMDEVEVNVEIGEVLMRELGLESLSDDVVQQHECLKTLKGAFAKKIKDNIGLSMKVTLLGFGQLPRSEGGKLSRVKDLRNL